MTTTQSENQILKNLVRRGVLSEILKDLNTSLVSSPRPGAATADGADKEKVQKEQMRQAAKIWTALTKLVRNQCNKGRIIDTLYFGSFGKSAVMHGDASADKSTTFTYCPGPKSIFTLVENVENMKTVPQKVSPLAKNAFFQATA